MTPSEARPPAGWAGALAENAKLTASDGVVNDSFGISVAVSGDTVVSGRGLFAYRFLKPGQGWAGDLIENSKLANSDGDGGRSFGESVAVNGGTAVVGAHRPLSVGRWDSRCFEKSQHPGKGAPGCR